LEAGVANGWLLVHARGLLIEASTQMAEQLAPSPGSGHRVVEAA
jgi:hypothetical protein